ncbi:MAG: TetR/AcrR family transcriptional regulator [Ignavibacteriales bacterium]
MVKRGPYAIVDQDMNVIAGRTDKAPAVDKRKQILQAALEEFAQSGYEAASTNRIIEDAGVSKGLLFYYFRSKRDLYLVTVEMCVQYFDSRVDREMITMSDDIMDRVIESGKAKLRIAAEQPLMFRLVSDAFLEPPGELKSEIQALQSRLYDKYMPYMTGGVDWSRLKETVDRQTAVSLILLVSDSIGTKYAKAYRDSGYKYSSYLEDAIHEIQVYFEMLKHGMYR